MRSWVYLVLPLLAACMPKADLVPLHAGYPAPMPQIAFPPSILPQMNQVFSGTLPFLNREMTLPPGSWEVGFSQTTMNKTDGLVGAVVALVQTAGTSMKGVLVFAGNARPLRNGAAVSKLCQSSDVIWNDVRAAVPQGQQDCTLISFERTALWRTTPRSVTAAIMLDLDLLNVQPPNIVVLIAAHEANQNWYLDEVLNTNPDLAGIAPDMSTQRAQSAWTAFRIAEDPEKQRYIATLKA